jgi:hypothetical protein
MDASWTFSCLFRRIGVILGTRWGESEDISSELGQTTTRVRNEQGGRTKILDRRIHLGHSDDVGNGSLGSDDTGEKRGRRQSLYKSNSKKINSPSERIRVLLSELLEEHDSQLNEVQENSMISPASRSRTSSPKANKERLTLLK